MIGSCRYFRKVEVKDAQRCYCFACVYTFDLYGTENIPTIGLKCFSVESSYLTFTLIF